MTSSPIGRPAVEVLRRPPLDDFVAKQASGLQRDYLSERKAAVARARRDLANLRNAATREPGTVPAIWEITMADLPGRPNSDAIDHATSSEWAAHLTLTLFAIHQQSRAANMHKPGVGFGQAIRALIGDADESTSPVRRRFSLAMGSQTLPAFAYHLRGLIGQLRAAGIPLDYGKLAGDIYTFQTPGGADKVRRRWMLQYYRIEKDKSETIEFEKTEE